LFPAVNIIISGTVGGIVHNGGFVDTMVILSSKLNYILFI